MANSGKSNRVAVEGLISDIKAFIEIVAEEIKDIEGEANALSSDWDDKQYDDFMEFVNELSSGLKRDLEALEDVNVHLKEYLKKFD